MVVRHRLDGGPAQVRQRCVRIRQMSDNLDGGLTQVRQRSGAHNGRGSRARNSRSLFSYFSRTATEGGVMEKDRKIDEVIRGNTQGPSTTLKHASC